MTATLNQPKAQPTIAKTPGSEWRSTLALLTLLTLCGPAQGNAPKAEVQPRQPLVTVSPPQHRKMLFDQALAQLRQNQLTAAEANFTALIRHDPQHTEALLALAAIAEQRQDSEAAQDFRQRAMGADPTHPGAQAGTLGDLAGGVHGAEVESRLRLLQSAHPASATVNFVLGNLFAGEKRWREAQQAYFSAVSLDPGNPDYLYNLALSLDRMRQHAPASRHYQLALQAREKRAASFDADLARQRLQALAP